MSPQFCVKIFAGKPYVPENTLKAAFNLFDPRQPLENGELDAFYVARPHAPLQRLKSYLLNTDEPVKVLFSGHRGSGKSTELRRLAKDVANDFCVVQVSVARDLNVPDLNYVDVVLASAIALLRQVVSHENYVPQHDELLGDILQFLENDITEDTTVAKGKSGSLTAKLGVLLVSMEAKYSRESTTRETIRKRLFPLINDLIERINKACKLIREQTGKLPLIIVEDIDKTDLAHARELFFNHAFTLNSLDCHIIYTFPLPLCYSNEFTERIGEYSTHFLLPNVSLYTRDGQPEPAGHDTLREVVTRRVDASLFEGDALEQVIASSAGLMRNIVRLVKDSALIALTEKAQTIQPHMAREVAAEMANDFRRVLLPAHYIALKEAHRTKNIVADEIYRQVLENLSLLEYQNTDNWCDVQPVVQKLLPSDDPPSDPAATTS